MAQELDVNEVAGALRVSISLLRRRLRQVQVEGELTLPETSALVRLDRGGPSSPGELAKLEQISPQSMGATLRSLEERGLVERRPDAADGRRAVISLTGAGLETLRNRRNARVERMARALSAEFTCAEIGQLMVLAPLIERLAQSI